jgi:hypothetical protein
MSSWRVLVAAWAGIAGIAIAVADRTSAAAVIAPVATAAIVLAGAALATDYFGLRQRRQLWTGQQRPSGPGRARIAALELRFHRDRERGAITTGATARALLFELAAIDAWARTSDVVDFLAAEALLRPTRDDVADGLRAIALAELGRIGEADRVLAGLPAARTPLLAWVRARVARRAGRTAEALAATALVRADRVPSLDPIGRDLALVRVGLLATTGAIDHARPLLAALARDRFRPEIEALALSAPAGLAVAAQEALGLRAGYRTAVDEAGYAPV